MNKELNLSEQLHELCTKFRIAIEKYVKDEPHKYLSRFPFGCCKTTSFLLARYLFKNGFDKPMYVNGVAKQKQSLTNLQTNCIRLRSNRKIVPIKNFIRKSNLKRTDELTKSVSHGWLQLGDLIIDITADQFGSEILPVIVDFEDSLYLQFSPYKFHEYDSYMKFNKSYKSAHNQMYSSIISLIN